MTTCNNNDPMSDPVWERKLSNKGCLGNENPTDFISKNSLLTSMKCRPHTGCSNAEHHYRSLFLRRLEGAPSNSRARCSFESCALWVFEKLLCIRNQSFWRRKPASLLHLVCPVEICLFTSHSYVCTVNMKRDFPIRGQSEEIICQNDPVLWAVDSVFSAMLSRAKQSTHSCESLESALWKSYVLSAECVSRPLDWIVWCGASMLN